MLTRQAPPAEAEARFGGRTERGTERERRCGGRRTERDGRGGTGGRGGEGEEAGSPEAEAILPEE